MKPLFDASESYRERSRRRGRNIRAVSEAARALRRKSASRLRATFQRAFRPATAGSISASSPRPSCPTGARILQRPSPTLPRRMEKAQASSRFQSLTCVPIWTPANPSDSTQRSSSFIASFGDCNGTVPSAEKRSGCAWMTEARWSFRKRERSSASSGLAQ